MIAVTGATGNMGRLVIEHLLERGVPAEQISALVRDPNQAHDLADRGIDVRHADYAQPNTLQPALRDVEKLLLISGSEVGRRLPQHRNVIDAAKYADVGLLVYTSILHADTSMMASAEEHIATERYIVESGLPHLIMRNGWYMENYTGNLNQVVESGTIYGAAGKGRVAAAARNDYAEAAAVLLTEDHGVDKVFELCGDEPFTYDELAAQIGKVAGTDVVYQNMDPDAYSEALTQAGLPLPMAAMLTDVDEGIARGDLDSNATDLVDLLHRPTMSLHDLIRGALA
ncbi:SDR family oxidoreductase [Glycomyces buryatensis]|uniref:SDR family oxidoreductase n=1 Tax=Glycomyces buryatensis TaxID=2570927 RepID=A0A4V4HSN0_9ACTN|nr:SDR family oxidoreductase [Glycomyces buryatensis]THV42336.1 SDR family oxidoreductase [Glycomyces buryatensis]